MQLFVTQAEWKADFAANVHRDPTTRKTWQGIEKAGIAGEAMLLLFWYAKGQPVVEEFARRNRRAVNAVRTAQRAVGIADGHAGASREGIFARRAEEKIASAAEAPWVNPYSHRTLADGVASHPEIYGSLPLDQLPSVMAKAGETVRRFDTRPLLLVLRIYARKRGVRLGLRRLVSLAQCARDGRTEDVQNLSRFFRRPDMKLAAPRYLEEFERFLASPPPPA